MNLLPHIKMLRPAQWVKNLMLLFPPFLGGEILRHGLWGEALVPLVSFCFVSSSTYVFNDILDRERDALHPKKRHRPIASGAVSLLTAKAFASALLVLALGSAMTVSLQFLLLTLLYLCISILYSVRLKQLPVVDIFCISAGFLLRLEAGGVAFGIVISDWLFLSVFLLAVFLSTGKRIHEKSLLGEGAGEHRSSLAAYPKGFLDGTMYLSGSAVLVTYTMYVIARHSLVYTVPLCCFGLLRFMFRVRTGKGGDPTESLLRDRQLFAVSLLWVLMFGYSIYWEG